jgi:tetrahydromethanopterin S-methyltransferase subunit G
MAETDVERLSRLMLGEFSRVHERFDQIDQNFANLSSEVTAIHRRLATLEEAVDNISGFAKEIDHLLTRVAEIEKHLGLTTHIKA